ncbi:MAG: carbohydrate-binding domain-containing protein [Rubripirellula sp.]
MRRFYSRLSALRTAQRFQLARTLRRSSKKNQWSVASLEPRLMLAGDAGIAVTSTPVAAMESAAPSSASTMTIGEIAFVDSDVTASDELISLMRDGVEVVLLNDTVDPLEQMSGLLQQRAHVQAVHIISHGESGRLKLGGVIVDSESLRDRAELLKSWRGSLAVDADVLIYGCDAAAGTEGHEFLQAWAKLTGADVAGSTNKTGSGLGQDWELESAIGLVDTPLVATATDLQNVDVALPVTIHAAGALNEEQMQLQVDGVVVATFDNIGGNANAGIFETYIYNVDGLSADQIRVVFTNDFVDHENGIDRNLRVDHITIDGVTYETEDPSVFSTGSWRSEDGIVPGFRESEYLHTDGYFEYAAVPNGSEITIQANGSTGEEIMELQIDGNVVQTWTDVGTTPASYVYTANETISPDRIRVAFTNDLFDQANGIDRNLIVDFVQVDEDVYQTEAPTVFSTGTWKPEDSVTPGFRESETLHTGGYFQYASAVSSGSLLTITAEGQTGEETMELRIDGVVVNTWTNVDVNPAGYIYQATGTVTADQVQIAFTNDLFDPINGIDRNLVVDRLTIDGQVYETEASDVFSTGTWKPEDGVTPGFRESETLHTGGYFQYATVIPEPGTLGLAETSFFVNESSGTLTLTVERTNGSDGAISIDYTTVAASATADSDYTTTSGTLDFADGQTSAVISIPILDDASDEVDESFTVTLENPLGGADTAALTAAITIIDNDPALLNNQQVFTRDGHLYLLTSNATTWTSAQVEAGSLGGNLVTISDAAEEAWLQQVFGTQLEYWIGLNDQATEGDFVWASGEELSYTNWAVGQPSDSLGNQNEVRMNVGTTLQWDDVSQSLGDAFGIIEIGSPAPPAPQSGLLGEYFDNQDFTELTVTRVDSIVDFDWATGSPDPSIVSDNFSVRWTGQVRPEFSETYTFRTLSDDGVRLWVDDQLIIDQWNDHAATYHTGTITLEADQLYDIRLEYFENGGNAVIGLEWSSASQTLEVVPQDRLVAAAPQTNTPNGSGFSTESIVEGLVEPISYAVADDGTIFVNEKAGRVQVVQNGQVVGTFLDINLEVNSHHDRGMMGIALDPDFATNGYVYLQYTVELNPGNPDEQNFNTTAGGRLIRMTAIDDGNGGYVADETSRFVIQDGHQMSHATHSVGDVDFDNAGNLIFTWGDGGFDNNLRIQAQDPNSKQGKLFRINRFTFEGIAANPYYDAVNPSSIASRVWALGVRNSWKLTVDRVTGDVYMGEVTDGGPEEINVMRADGSTVLNYGWPYYQGDNPTSHATPPLGFVYEGAFVALPHTNAGGGDSILGGAVFRGDAYPEVYDGRYFFANLNQGIIYSADQTGAYQQFGTSGDYAGVVDMQLGPDGHFWMLNLFTGKLERLVYTSSGTENTDPVAIASATTTAGIGPVTVTLDASASSDPDGDSVQYAWDFNDDGVIDSFAASESFQFDTLGRNDVSLVVFDGVGGADWTTVEIEVLAQDPGDGNLALGRPAEQSPTDGDAIASRANDGNTIGLPSIESVSRTTQTRTPLWEVDLGASYSLSRVELSIPAGDELSDFWVLVSDNPFSSGNLDAARSDPGVTSIQFAGAADPFQQVLVDTVGRYVRIQRAGVNHVLALAEVKVIEA